MSIAFHQGGRKGECGAFALIELLVVIAIISILAALLVPALNDAMEAGRQAMCTSNLRQLAIAEVSNANDHDGKFYSDYSSSTHVMFKLFPALLPYLGDNHAVLVCPKDRRDPETAKNPGPGDTYRPDGKRHLNSYGFNAYLHFHYPGLGPYFAGGVSWRKWNGPATPCSCTARTGGRAATGPWVRRAGTRRTGTSSGGTGGGASPTMPPIRGRPRTHRLPAAWWRWWTGTCNRYPRPTTAPAGAPGTPTKAHGSGTRITPRPSLISTEHDCRTVVQLAVDAGVDVWIGRPAIADNEDLTPHPAP